MDTVRPESFRPEDAGDGGPRGTVKRANRGKKLRRLMWLLSGTLLGMVITVAWGVLIVAVKLSSYNTEWLKTDMHWLSEGKKQWLFWVLPFLPGAALAGAAVGYLASKWASRRFLVSLVSAIAPVVSFGITTAVCFVVIFVSEFGKFHGGAAHSGDFWLLLLLGPFLGLTAAPLWALTTFLLLCCVPNRNAGNG